MSIASRIKTWRRKRVLRQHPIDEKLWRSVVMRLPFLAGFLGGLLMARVVVATRITDDYVWIKGVNPEFLAALPPFPGGAIL